MARILFNVMYEGKLQDKVSLDHVPIAGESIAIICPVEDASFTSVVAKVQAIDYPFTLELAAKEVYFIPSVLDIQVQAVAKKEPVTPRLDLSGVSQARPLP